VRKTFQLPNSCLSFQLFLRFWSYIAVFAMLVVVGPLEVLSWFEFDDTSVAVNLIKVLTAASIFAMFVLARNLRSVFLKPQDNLLNDNA
jgi:hypothetical protein